MDAHLTNQENIKTRCFFAKKMTYLESSDFAQNEDHLSNCEDCRLRLAQFDFQKELLLKDFASFKADEEVSQTLEAELEEIIPRLTQQKTQVELPKRSYSFSLRDFFVYILFGIPRKVQLAIVVCLILAACIY